MARLFLLRYDTEGAEIDEMAGFLATAADVHTRDDIPAAFCCTGRAVELREPEFREFAARVRDDRRFDVLDHSYSHVGVGYEAGRPVPELRADYERSFAVHERVFGRRPAGVGRCGTAGRDGALLSGFDATDKARAELDMLAALGVHMYNTFLSTADPDHDFIDYAELGHPEVIGFPSANVDVHWMYEREYGDPLTHITGEIRRQADAGRHMAVVLHDWCAWKCADDKKLTHVRRMADTARKHGYEIVTPKDCLDNRALWQE